MDKAAARQQTIDHLTALIADANEALAATDIWLDYSPRDREKSLALYAETRDVASRLLANVENSEPVARADWRRVMPRDAQWNDLYKAVFADSND